ncbi:MAG: S8 family serine peptidase [Anaerolineae bacterium]|nr:S8 family serine peptidase [Anaerolineae bacterium]
MTKRTFSQRSWIAWLAIMILALSATAPVALGAISPQADSDPPDGLHAKPGQFSYLVFLNVQADLSGAEALPSRAARGQYVYQALRTVAEQSQAALRADLEAWGVPYRPFFIVNAIRVTGDEVLAQRLAARPDVARVVADPEFDGLDDPPAGPPGPAAVDAVEWNIARTNADDVWALGYTGQGIVVGSCDTGVEWQHPALVNQYRPWIPGAPTRHDYNWYDSSGQYSEPTALGSHGTHTTGTIVGDDSAGNQIGMAPGAQWIACLADPGGAWKASNYLACWEWFLAPTRLDGADPRPDLAPHVINNSWSCPAEEGCDPDTLRDGARALYAAGIAIAKSAGNSGSACATITNPGHYPELLATGAFNSSDAIASFSSRGPVTVDGETRIKPDIAAPGVGIRSSVPGGGYGSSQGTSMASPHTAGLIALLWSANPALIGDLATTYQIVESSAQPKIDLQCAPNAPGGRPNNVWGWGIIDALAAVQAANDTGLGALSGVVTDSSTGQPLPGVELAIVQADNSLERQALTGPAGEYQATLLAATYDVTATLYGYLPGAVAGVVVPSGTLTTLDLALDPAPVWTLSGQVTDQGSGAPLMATLAVLGTPVTVTSDPASGEYNAQVAQGSYTLRVSSPGYISQDRAIDMQANLVEDFALAPQATYLVRDSEGPCGPVFDWIDVTGTGTPRNLADDANTYVALPAGQPFSFYGTSYTGLYIGSNGYVTFGAGSSYSGGNTIPSTFLPNNAIYAFWDDLNPASGAQGTIYTQVVDNHLFVVEFYQVQHYPNGDPETFEIVLDLDSGAILLQYLAVSDTHWTSVGVENSAGTSGIGYSFHDPAVPADGLAVAFYPVTGAHPAEQGLGTLAGTVTALPGGQGIDGAQVLAEGTIEGQVAVLIANAAGVYSGTLCADVFSLTASAPGYHPVTVDGVTVFSGTNTVQDFALEHTQADLWLTKVAPASAAPGDMLTYTLSFGSNGPDEVASGRVYDALPAEVTWISGGTYDPGMHGISLDWFNALPGYSATLEVVVQLSPDVTATEVCNTAGIEATCVDAPLDPAAENNTDTACTATGPTYRVYLPIVLKNAP